MKIAGFAAAASLLLTGPALAGSVTSDRPMVVAEDGGLSIHLGDGDRDRDARRHHPPIVVVGGHHDRDRHHENDRDHGHDR